MGTRCYAAECFGTFTLVFAGTGAVIVNDTSGGPVTLLGIAIAFGLTVLAMIYALGDVSGAHLNPAVTIAFWVARRMPWWRVPGYVLSQCAGALLASLLLRFLFPAHATLGAALPSGAVSQAFIFEVVLTCFLMFVILSVSTGAKEKGITAGIAIGSVIVFDILIGGPISGGSMNPARSLGPAIASGTFSHLWVYLSAPIIGACIAVGLCRAIHGPACLGSGATVEDV